MKSDPEAEAGRSGQTIQPGPLGTREKALEVKELEQRMQREFDSVRGTDGRLNSDLDGEVREWLNKVRNKQLGTFEARRRRLLSNWVRGSNRKVSYEMKLAARREFDLDAEAFTTRGWTPGDLDDDLVNQTQSDLRRLYESTQEQLEDEIEDDTVTLFRGVAGVDPKSYERGSLDSWTSDPGMAAARAAEEANIRGGDAVVLSEEIPVSRILTSHNTTEWADGPFDGQDEFVVLGE